MPSIAHLILGGFIGIFLYKISNGKFSKHHVFILFMNNYIGPDTGWALNIGSFTHTLFGNTIYSLLLSIFYSYFTKFSIDYKKKVLIDNGNQKLNFLATYFVVMAGGIMHIYLDGVINYNGTFYYFPQIGDISRIDFTIMDFIQFWSSSAIGINTIASVIGGIIFIIGFIHFFTYFLQTKDIKSIKSMLYSIFYIIAFMIYFYLFGNYSTAYHADAGAIIFIFSFWIIPIFLLYLSTFYNPKIMKTETKIKFNLSNFMIIIYFFIGIILMMGGILCILFRQTISEYIINLEPLFLSFEIELEKFFLIISFFLITFGLIDFFVGRTIKSRKFMDFRLNLVISYFIIISFLIGFAIITLLILKYPLVDYLYLKLGYKIEPYIEKTQIINLIIPASIILAIFSGLNLLMSFGLLFKNKKLYHLTIILNSLAVIAVYPVSIACYLCENKIKEFYNFER